MSEQETELNRKAFFALKGVSSASAAELVALLRSDEPIHRVVRDTLADALEDGTVDGTRLTIIGHKPNRDIFVGLQSRREWLEIGSWIEAQIQRGMARHHAIEAAALEFPHGEKYCEKALDYKSRLEKWLARMDNSPLRQVLGPELMVDLFHQQDAAAKPLDD